MAKAKIETYLAAVEKAQSSLDSAREALDKALSDVDVGYVFQIDNIPWQVIDHNGKRKAQCMLSKRAMAAIKGEDVPPPRKRRTKAEKEADEDAQ